MKILHTVEFYTPSVGGAQEVVRQISERLVRRGHDVTVATTTHPERSAKVINGVKIEEFGISGNAVHGFSGEIECYQRFLIDSDFDIMMNYAAQQWAMDLVFPVLDRIPYCKVMIPCGFSGLYDPAYNGYFDKMPDVMRGYDHLVFHADDYRDTNFARQSNISHISIIPNGASEIEFCLVDHTFRSRNSIPEDVPMLLTIGSHTAAKGHRLCIEAFRQLDVDRAVLVIIGNIPDGNDHRQEFFKLLLGEARRLHVIQILKMLVRAMLGGTGPGCLPDDRMHSRWINIRGWGKKRMLLLYPPRQDVVAALQAADLFIFGSNVEYSPLVLYEAVAARTPFISLACGNAPEIASWTGGGVIAPTIQKEHGFVDGAPDIFAEMIADLLADEVQCSSLAEAGYRAWRERFTWEKIVDRYEELYVNLLEKKHD